jgi:hypothetical protein
MEYVAVLLPSLVVGLLFWFAMRAIFNADKSERQAEAKAQAEADARAARAAVQAQPTGQPPAQPFVAPADKQPGKPDVSAKGNPEAIPPAGPSRSSSESDK